MKEISFRNDVLPVKDKIYRLALRITLNQAEAEDIVQDTLIRVWNKQDEWQNFSSMEAYCLTVCRNMSLDRISLKGNRTLTLDDQPETPDLSTPHDTLTRKEQMNLVEKLLETLPEVQRSIIQLREMEGKTYKEIAEILNLSEEKVKVYLFRARQRIRQAYEKIDGYGL
ncbi:MAG: RNA polymerase sigma factor [Clostridium sp.]|nr:RNA polymerase sigma factor [Clostridium sp.]